MAREALGSWQGKRMRKLLCKAICAASVLLAASQLIAQGLTTDFEAHPLMTKSTSCPQDSATSESERGYDAGQISSDESCAATGRERPNRWQEGKSEGSVYPGMGTMMNGLPVYVSAMIKIGDRVQTGEEVGRLTVGAVNLDLGLNTVVSIQEPLILSCGVIFVRSGTIAINDGRNTFSFATGQTAYAASTSCDGVLPDSPGAVRSGERATPYRKSGTRYQLTATGGWLFDGRIMDRPFVAVNGMMFSSSIAAAELTQRCLSTGACTDVPGAFRSRAAMYGAGLPAAAGVAYLGYYLKSKGYRWWFVPAAVVTAGDIVVATHAAHFSH